MKALLPALLPVLLPVLLLAACASEPQQELPGARALSAEGSPLRVLQDAEPGPAGEDPPCEELLPGATCTRIGDVVWTLQADGGSWQLTAFSREEGRWTARVQGSGGGLSPVVSDADLTAADQPETLVVYGGGFDVVSDDDEGRPVVVVHGEGQASVEDGQVRAGDRWVRRAAGRWVSVPAS